MLNISYIIIGFLSIAFTSSSQIGNGECPDLCWCNRTEIYCENQFITNIPKNVPVNTTHLYLSGNFISAVKKSDFSNLTQLTVLGLSSNQISEIENEAFKWLYSLKVLILSDNPLAKIREETFKYLDGLEILGLSRVNDKKPLLIDDHAFKNLNNLTELKLDNNRLASITRYTFHGLYSLQRLDLAFNDLHVIDSEAFSDFQNSYVYLDGNGNMLCCCVTMEAFQTQGVSVTGLCKDGMSFFNVMTSQIKCNNKSEVCKTPINTTNQFFNYEIVTSLKATKTSKTTAPGNTRLVSSFEKNMSVTVQLTTLPYMLSSVKENLPKRQVTGKGFDILHINSNYSHNEISILEIAATQKLKYLSNFSNYLETINTIKVTLSKGNLPATHFSKLLTPGQKSMDSNGFSKYEKVDKNSRSNSNPIIKPSTVVTINSALVKQYETVHKKSNHSQLLTSYVKAETPIGLNKQTRSFKRRSEISMAVFTTISNLRNKICFSKCKSSTCIASMVICGPNSSGNSHSEPTKTWLIICLIIVGSTLIASLIFFYLCCKAKGKSFKPWKVERKNNMQRY